MWFKYGLKAQKLLAQGSALGIIAISNAPCKGKSFVYCRYLKAFALTGRQACFHHYPGRCPGLGASALSGRVEEILAQILLRFIITKTKFFILKTKLGRKQFSILHDYSR